MARFLRILLAVSLFGIFLAPPAFAARVTMSSDSLTGKTGDDHGIAVSVTLKEGDYEGANPSTNEKAQFVVESPRDGDRCVTSPAPSDSSGKVTGTCYASKPGSVSVYAKSTDRGDQSEKVTLEFSEGGDEPDVPDDVAPPDQPDSDEAQKAAAMKQYQAQQAAQQAGAPPGAGGGAGSALANQPGLAPDKETGTAGLGSGSVEGTATSSTENNPRSDLDLINSLIYLVAGVVLIIACLYFIWFQMKEHQARMEKKNAGGSSPPSTPPIATSTAKPESLTGETAPVAPPPIPPTPPTPNPEKAATPSYDPTTEHAQAVAPITPAPIKPKSTDSPIATNEPASSQDVTSAKPTLAQLRTSMPPATAVIPTTAAATIPPGPEPTHKPEDDEEEEDVPDHASWSVDAIAKRITDEINKSKSS